MSNDPTPEILAKNVVGWHGGTRFRILGAITDLGSGAGFDMTIEAAPVVLDEELEKRIRTKIRTGASPRHVPAKIVAVADIPRTKSGKIVELAVRHVVHGRPVKNVEALANPEALEHFRDRRELADL